MGRSSSFTPRWSLVQKTLEKVCNTGSGNRESPIFTGNNDFVFVIRFITRSNGGVFASRLLGVWQTSRHIRAKILHKYHRRQIVERITIKDNTVQVDFSTYDTEGRKEAWQKTFTVQ
jgi:hypothetical protein